MLMVFTRGLRLFENIRYFGQLHGLRGQILEDRIADLSKRLEMDSFLNRAVAGFSQGQRMEGVHSSSSGS